jgi:hypothetical protein
MAVRQSSPRPAAIVPPRAIAYEGRRGRNDNAEERMTTSDPEPRIVAACVLIIGNEILSGRTQALQAGLRPPGAFLTPL